MFASCFQYFPENQRDRTVPLIPLTDFVFLCWLTGGAFRDEPVPRISVATLVRGRRPYIRKADQATRPARQPASLSASPDSCQRPPRRPAAATNPLCSDPPDTTWQPTLVISVVRSPATPTGGQNPVSREPDRTRCSYPDTAKTPFTTRLWGTFVGLEAHFVYYFFQ
jgi:hypothetical protein